MFTVVEASVQNKKENEYMMKAVMRVANVLQDAVVPFAQDIVQVSHHHHHQHHCHYYYDYDY